MRFTRTASLKESLQKAPYPVSMPAKKKYDCEVCDCSFTGANQLAAHTAGKKHKKKALWASAEGGWTQGAKPCHPEYGKNKRQKLDTKESENEEASDGASDDADAAIKATMETIKQAVKNGDYSRASELPGLQDSLGKAKPNEKKGGKKAEKKENNLFTCDLCGVKNKSEAALEQHQKGKKHLQKMEAKEKGAELPERSQRPEPGQGQKQSEGKRKKKSKEPKEKYKNEVADTREGDWKCACGLTVFAKKKSCPKCGKVASGASADPSSAVFSESQGYGRGL
jgi:hypothetical protein